MHREKALGIIPARGGSKRLPRKNLALLAGKPLLLHSIEAGLQAKELDRLVVSSEDDEILALASSISPNLVLRRPDYLAQDISLAYDVVMHALTQLESRGEGPYAFVAVIQCSSPLTTAEDIDETMRELRATDADSVCTIMELDHYLHPLKLKVLEDGRLRSFFGSDQAMQPAHELPRLFVRNGSVYASRRRVLEQGVLIGQRGRGYLMPRERSIDINTAFDLAFAEFLLSRQRSEQRRVHDPNTQR